MTMISLWVKNKVQKLISDPENQNITLFIAKEWLDPVESGKARLLLSVSGCHADRLETFEWRANRMMGHLESMSYKEGFMTSGLKIFHGWSYKKRGMRDVLSQKGRTDWRTLSGTDWVNMSKKLLGYKRWYHKRYTKWRKLHWKVTDSSLYETIWR